MKNKPVRILVLGAGRMGRAVVHDLLHNSNVEQVEQVGVADNNRAALQKLVRRFGRRRLTLHPLDTTNQRAVLRVFRGYHAVASAVPYRQNLALARTAIRAGVHFCDLGGNNDIRQAQQKLDRQAKRRGVALLPDCGLAPGIPSVLVAHGAPAFQRLERIDIAVGGLPQKPQPPLNYALYFSPEGLINEFHEPVEIITKGKRRLVEPLTGNEPTRFAGLPPLEAFYTSGGSSTLPRTFPRVRELHERTIRYRGHCTQVAALRALGLFDSKPVTVQGRKVVPRQLLVRLLEENLAWNQPDIVLVRTTLEGKTSKGRRRLVYEIVDRFDRRTGLTAMMRTTAFPLSMAAQLLARGGVAPGVHTQEEAVPADWFLRELRKRNIQVRRHWLRS